jgi:hypothetical protein
MVSREPKPVVIKTRGADVKKPKMPLEERWRATIPGDHAQAFAADAVSRSLLVGDGWGTPYTALSLHKFGVDNGTEVASIRTRHQQVLGMAIASTHAFAATDSRLFKVSVSDLRIIQEWNRHLVRYSNQVQVDGGHVVEANWLAPSIGILEMATGTVRRLKGGAQPMLFRYAGQIRLISGLEGGMATVDVEAGKLVDRVRTPAVSAVAAGQDIWAVVGGEAEAPSVSPPPHDVKLPLFRRGTNEIVRLSGEPTSLRIDGRCRQIWCDDVHKALWCFVEGPSPPNAVIRGYAISQLTGDVLASFETETSSTLRQLDPQLGIVPVHLAYLNVELGVVLTTQTESRRMRDNICLSSTSTLVCYSLPALKVAR